MSDMKTGQILTESSSILPRLLSRIKASLLGMGLYTTSNLITGLWDRRHKAPTTTNPSLGINDALMSMFDQSKVDPEDVASVTIGTTVSNMRCCVHIPSS